MAEYIDRVQLLADIENTIRISAKDTDSSELRGARKVIDRIKAMPAADAVNGSVDVQPVVYCEDCVHNYSTAHNPMCDFMDAHLYPNSYCSYGERKN